MIELAENKKKTRSLRFRRNGRVYSYRLTLSEAKRLKWYADKQKITVNRAINNLVDKALTGLQSDKHCRRQINAYDIDMTNINIKESLLNQLLKSPDSSYTGVLSAIITTELNIAERNDLSDYKRKGLKESITWLAKEGPFMDSLSKLNYFNEIKKKGK